MEGKFDKNSDIELENDRNEYTDTEIEDVEEFDAAKIKKLREKLKEAEKEKMSALEDLQRARADFLNAKKRLEEDRVRDKERSLNDFVERLLPLCDSFDMALLHDSLADLPENTKKGLLGIHSQLSSILKSYNVDTIGEVGTDFDPRFHEALSEVEVADKSEDHKIAAVIQKGYKINDTIIRPARVTVGVFKNL